MYLVSYDFVIKYRLGKWNLIDVPLKRPDYKKSEILILKYFLLFEQKFTTL